MSALKPKLYTVPRCGSLGEKAAGIPIRRCVLGGLGKCTLNVDVCFSLFCFSQAVSVITVPAQCVTGFFFFCFSQAVSVTTVSAGLNSVSDRLYQFLRFQLD
jgi:hypothetical protein